MNIHGEKTAFIHVHNHGYHCVYSDTGTVRVIKELVPKRPELECDDDLNACGTAMSEQWLKDNCDYVDAELLDYIEQSILMNAW